VATALTDAIDRFASVEDEAQLRELEENLSKFVPSRCGEAEFCSLLAVFERFPDEDGFGVFWSIVHLLEACNGYESFVAQSVLRKPSEFNVVMINRLVNRGVTSVEGQSLFALLASVGSNPAASARATACARTLSYQAGQGRAEA
jgi:hypothetical protein